MKKILLLLCASVAFSGLYAQEPTPLYGAQKYGNQLYKMDTTGGGMSVISTITMTSPYYMYGTYGLGLDPTTDIMYILYETNHSGNRRLGTLNVLTGAITDIGIAGDLADIAFGPDGRLYATENSWNYTFDFVEINKLTGAQTFLLGHTNSTRGASICYDPFNNKMLKFDRSDIASINLGTMVETNESPISLPYSDVGASVVYSPTKAMTVHWGTLYRFNTSTKVFTYVGSAPGQLHALAFGVQPCVPIDIVASTIELCEGDPVNLDATALGTITWDGGITDGVDFIPGPAGVYHYTPTSDSEEDCESDGIDITVIALPTILAGSGDLNYCVGETVTLSASGDADLYVWNDGDALDLSPPVGTTTYNLTGSYVGGGCVAESSTSVTITMHELPVITASVDEDLICLGNEVTFTGAGGVGYWWDVLGVIDGEPYMPNALGITTYTVTGTDEFNCSNTATVDVEVVEGITITATATDEIAGADGTLDITISGGAPIFSFDWDNDGTGDFDDTEDLTGLTAGFYTVIVQSSAGCSETKTYRIDSQLSVDETENAIISVYPNPTQELVNIELTGAFQFEIVTINGQIIQTGTATDKKVVSLKDYADGIYFVNVSSDVNTTTFKVVKK